jgi:hypothetical protein
LDPSGGAWHSAGSFEAETNATENGQITVVDEIIIKYQPKG